MFSNEPLTDYSISANRTLLLGALTILENRINNSPFTIFPIINGQSIKDRPAIPSLDPSAPQTTLGNIHLANIQDCDNAIASLRSGFLRWRSTSSKERASILRKIGAAISKEKAFFTALIIRESGKPWIDSDADVAEAIDFCNYYADEIERLSVPQLTDKVAGEESFYLYQPRGVCVVIAPWNFPLAILCGMSVAALAAGNSVVLKPAEQTSIIAGELFRIFLESGVPHDVAAFLPGIGEEIGAHLVKHAETDMICFTGSQPVGLSIIRDAAISSQGRSGIKRVVAELGGKNAIIIDSDCDIDEALSGVLVSAFGYAGQKCSACSRLIIVGEIYEEFMQRLADATRDFPIGIASDPASVVGPVIDNEAQSRILATIEKGKESCHLLCQAVIPNEGYFVPPTIFKNVPTHSAIWQEEIFGPVIAAVKAPTFEEAIKLANDSKYALTGGVYSRLPSHINYARENFQVGNLYINRKITGALVKRHPFGGFKMSGIGSKAGGPDYLLQFMEPRVITENTVRRGFAG